MQEDKKKIYSHVNYIWNFKCVFLTTMSFKSVTTITQKPLKRFTSNFFINKKRGIFSTQIGLLTLTGPIFSTKISFLIEELKWSPQNVLHKTLFDRLRVFSSLLVIFLPNFDETSIKLYTFGCWNYWENICV